MKDQNLELSEAEPGWKFPVEESILILLLILSLVGMGITDFSPDDGYWYWIIMIFVFWVSAMIIAKCQLRNKNKRLKRLFFEQALHWIGSLLIVIGAFVLLYTGHLNEENTGLVILLILSLATFLDGLRVGWRFSIAGLFLGFSAIIAAFFDHFIFYSLLLAITIVILTVMWEKWRVK